MYITRSWNAGSTVISLYQTWLLWYQLIVVELILRLRLSCIQPLGHWQPKNCCGGGSNRHCHTSGITGPGESVREERVWWHSTNPLDFINVDWILRRIFWRIFRRTMHTASYEFWPQTYMYRVTAPQKITKTLGGTFKMTTIKLTTSQKCNCTVPCKTHQLQYNSRFRSSLLVGRSFLLPQGNQQL